MYKKLSSSFVLLFEVSVFNSQMIHNICSAHSIQVCTLTIINEFIIRILEGLCGLVGKTYYLLSKTQAYLGRGFCCFPYLLNNFWYKTPRSASYLAHSFLASLIILFRAIYPYVTLSCIFLLVQCFHILENVVGFFGGAYEKYLGDVMFLFKMTAHGNTGIQFSTSTSPRHIVLK